MEPTLPVFDPSERDRAHRFLATRVAGMMGRKFEEGDWSDAYCYAKKIPKRAWSNLSIDVMHHGLGVEHKMICTKMNRSIQEVYGTTIMHPSGTRSLRIPIRQRDPTACARDVLRQYGELIQERSKKVREDGNVPTADMRVGWLLWEESLTEFLYFERRMTVPNPLDYTAIWKEKKGTGARKATKNLWVYEIATGLKRFSITNEAGVKIQPYFDVPPPNDENLYYFRTQGEPFEGGVRIWITQTTAGYLSHLLGSIDGDTVSNAILTYATLPSAPVEVRIPEPELALCVSMTLEAYERLKTAFTAVSDEHRVQQLIRAVQESQKKKS